MSLNLHSLRALRGPNRWADVAMIELRVGWPQAGPDEVDERLLELVSELAERGVDAERDRPVPGGCTEVSAWLLARVIAALQSTTGVRVDCMAVGATRDRLIRRIAVEYHEEAVARAAVHLALDWVDHPATVKLDLARRLEELEGLSLRRQLGPSTQAIVDAARRRRIYACRLNEGNLVQLGQGARLRRIWASETSACGAIAETIAQDKELTKTLLSAAGIPVPSGRVVSHTSAAWSAALEVGLPVVVKPRDGNQGRGVSVNLDTRSAVITACERALTEGDEALVEHYIAGDDHRLLVVGNRLIAAARREPPCIVGDGEHTVFELVAIANEDPRRGEDHATVLSKLLLDDLAREVLTEQHLGPDDIPLPGQVVRLRHNANLSTGGSAVDVTDEVHPEVAARAVEAARIVGLDVSGIDIVASDITRPLEVSGGAVVEVNAAPGLRMHLSPSIGRPRDVGAAIIDSLFPNGDDGRIPIVAVTGTNGKTTTVRCIANLLRNGGRRVGLATTEGIFVDDDLVDSGDCSGPNSARAVLAHPEVEAAVLETARGGILREGLGFDWCDVAVVTNIGAGDHLGLSDVETVRELVDVKSTVLRRLMPRGVAVLNAEDPLVVDLAANCRGSVIYFARHADTPALVAHQSSGGQAIYCDEGTIWLAEGRRRRPLALAAELPSAHGARVGFQLQNLMAAAAAGWALRVPDAVLRQGLLSFSGASVVAPARFEVVEHQGRTFIFDYGHNADALRALVEAVDCWPSLHRSIVYTAAGDRRDEDILEQARIIGDHFDRVYLYEDQCRRGRSEGAVVGLMREGLALAGRVQQVIHGSGERAVIEQALGDTAPGELLLCQVDQVASALGWIDDWLVAHGGARLRPRAA